MRSYLRLPAAGLFFFVSAWILMLGAGMTTRRVGIKPFGYTTAMVLTLGLWLVLAPAIGAIARPRWRRRTVPRSADEHALY
ncbi:MAG TPA: hypothetical protein VEI83_00110 [Acidimicrobiales bacterium]|nr:hypothetical protein [Acidimicrobiales bacterium]